MDTKSLDCKHPKKMKSSKDKQEVFVLPPDILKKLGISIGNINDSQVIPTDANDSPSTEIINNEHIDNFPSSNGSQNPSDTSIVETANLMKESVFLSPTFVPPLATVIPGETDILSKNTTEDSFAGTDLERSQNSVFVPADSIEVAHLLPDSNDTQKDCLKVDQAKLHYNITQNREQISLANTSQGYPYMSLDGNQMQEVDMMTFDENLSEFESHVDNVLDDEQSFKSNNNVEFTASSTDRDSTCISLKNGPNTDIPATKPSKINIISEETIPLSKIRELKILQSSNIKNLTPVTVQSIIDTKTDNEDWSSGQQSTIETNCAVPLRNTKLLHSDLDVVKSGEITNKTDFKLIVTVATDVDKSVTICNSEVDKGTEPEVDPIKKHCFTKNECESNKDNVEKRSPLQQEAGIEKHNISKKNFEGKSNIKSSNSKTALGNTVKKLIELKISSSKKVEDKTGHDKLASILNATKKSSSSLTDIKADKVKEIAAYLKKFSHIYTDKKKTKTALSNDIIKKENINTNTNTIESKLCIQGVEKPGGNEVDREHTGECKVLKTYRRNPSKSKPSTDILQKSETCNKIDALDQDLHAVTISTSCEMQEFCLCYDFGRLAYYDCDDLYEHIHFWHHNTANCELDLIFAIYNDETIVNNNESGLEQDEKTEEKLEVYNICWNIFQSEFSENVDNSDAELIGHNYVIDELKETCSSDSPQLPELDNVAQKGNDGILSKIHDQVHMKNNSNSDIILETIEHDMVDAAESKNSILTTNNISSAAVTSADSGHINSDLTTSQTILTPTTLSEPSSSVISNDLDKVCIVDRGAKEKTYQHEESINNAREELKLNPPETNEKPAFKRSLVGITIPASLNNNGEPSSKKSIKCGFCNNIFSRVDWEDHVATQHDLIAWRAGSSINLDNPELVFKLKERLKNVGELKCSICNIHIRKYTRFIEHIKYCIKKKLSNTDKKAEKPMRKSRTATDENVTCGVCQRTMRSSNWLQHIGRNHDYLAWTSKQDALNLDNESVVRKHLQSIIRLTGSLTCNKCGFSPRRVKTYLAHLKTCDGSEIIPEDKNLEETVVATTVTCGVCNQGVTHSEWIDHISKEHNYLAWQDGETPLDLEEEEAVWNHLQQFIRRNGGLICHKCGIVRKRVKLYLTHVETCDGTNSQIENSSNISLNTTTNSTDEWFEVPIISEERKIVKCGVCSEEVPILEWLQHIGKEHDYLAWQDGSPPLDLNDELAVQVHLLDISKQSGGLVCNKCAKRLKYPKTYRQHSRECTGVTVSPDSSRLVNSTPCWIESFSKKNFKDEIVTCAVCATKIESAKWINHIETEHQYLAWVEGQPPLDREDAVMVQRHLNDVSKLLGGLVCTKCGVRRKYVKSYLHHAETCQGKMYIGELSIALMNKDIVECAVCAATMEPQHWRNHAMQEHYNIAWVVGDSPIEINNAYAIENYLKEYQHVHKKLICKVCGISRASCTGFYAHIIVCGKTEKETEIYKSVCDICHNKYLLIYKSQHMTMHRAKEYAMERKLLVAKEKEIKKGEGPVDVIHTGRRRAAERARNVIEKYKNGVHDSSYNCSKCGFSSDIEKELSDHVCVEDKWSDATDSDVSVNLETCSEDDSDESDIDSNVSDEEREACAQASHKKKNYSDSISAKIARLPYQTKNVGSYMKRSTEEFIETYLTDEDLFTQWHSCELEEVPENEVVNYMPPIEESCKVRFDDDQEWLVFNRFESNRVKDTIVMFMGASIQCMSWVPAAVDPERSSGEAQYLAVVTHRGTDAPRYAWDFTISEHGLIQIWDCGNLIASTPRFALGIAHDFGTVWSIDWCPSGARDVFDFVPESNKIYRLGLLAAACSNGSAYIFVVPYPSSITEKEKPFYKIKPIVELRLASNENRKVYQATAVKWSIQKGHSDVVVGYADGTTAFYDLNGESPLLRTAENNVIVIYPYHDERVQNSCIEDLDMYPSGAGAGRAGGVVCAGSAGGAGAGVLQSHVAAAKVLYPPHWPAALLAGDDCLVNQSINELEWWGGGRRLGGSRVAAGCAWCGRVCAAAPPLLRLLRLHPCFPDVHKQVIGKIQMVPLGSKRKRQNDELAMIVEPITYDDAVKKYGIEFKQIAARDRTTQQKLSATPRDAYPERFPLSDVAALQFCPTFKHHHKLALAMHTGLVFIFNV